MSDGEEEEWHEELAQVEEDGDEYSLSSDDEDDSSVGVCSNRSLLWLCQEGLTEQANRKYDILLEQQQELVLEREVFQKSRNTTTALTEILMGGTSDRNAYQLATKLLQYMTARNNHDVCRDKVRHILSLQPRSAHRRTALHWACWGNANLDDVIKPLVQCCPQALLLRDARSSGHRTPVELFQYYFCGGRRTHDVVQPPDDGGINNATHHHRQEKLEYLHNETTRWLQHCLRNTVYQCALRYFSYDNDKNRSGLTPFDQKHRKQTKIRPKQWFVLSVLGSLIQREMKPLAWHILGFVGYQATEKHNRYTSRRRAKRKKPPSSSAQQEARKR